MSSQTEILTRPVETVEKTVSHFIYEWESRTLCGTPGSWKGPGRHPTLPMCLICEALAEAHEAVRPAPLPPQ